MAGLTSRPSAGERRPAGSHRSRVATLIVTAAAAVAVAVILTRRWSDFLTLIESARWVPLVAAGFIFIVGSALSVIVAYLSLRSEDVSISFRAVYRLVAVAGLAKFIPGGIWQVGSQYGLGREEGLGFRQSMLVWVEPSVFNLTVGGSMALVAAAFVDYGIPASLLVVSAAVVLTASTNPVRHRIYRIVRLMPRDARRPAAFAGWPIRVGVTAVAVAGSGVYGMLITSAFDLASAPGFAGSLAAFVGAWAIGFLFFPVPGGLGVREGALTVLLSPWMPAHEALLVATASRLISVAGELASAAVGVVARFDR